MPVYKMQIAPEQAYSIYKKMWMNVYARPVALFAILRNLFSKNVFDQAIAKNFIMMPMQMKKLSAVKALDIPEETSVSKTQKPVFDFTEKIPQVALKEIPDNA